jgi:hypothetical protein
LMAAGTCDKYLGPSRSVSLTWRVTEDVMTLFGVELVMRVNPELEAKMQQRLERRDERSVREQKRLSKKLLEVAKSQLFTELGKRGGAKRAASLTAKQRSEIARSGGVARHRVTAASGSEGASA